MHSLVGLAAVFVGLNAQFELANVRRLLASRARDIDTLDRICEALSWPKKTPVRDRYLAGRDITRGYALGAGHIYRVGRSHYGKAGRQS